MRLTPESIQTARQWFADNALARIDEVQAGRVRVNHPEAYFARCLQDRADALAGKWDHTFTFQQRANYIQTGVCVPLLG